tara:strand:+ start:2121 stop:2933 length:813 start_codon:yes stop_codon:yes gene_type:complete
MKRIIAGPWVGEFGWELFAWHAYVRSLAKNFDRVVIISRENSKSLYDDFADEFISYSPVGGLSDSFFMHKVDAQMCLREVVKANNIRLDKDTTILLPRRIGLPPHTHYTQPVIFGEYVIKPEYICFGETGEKKYDYIFHIRDRKLRQEDNWSKENWIKLKNNLKSDKIACIGTKAESGWIEGTDDLRDIDLGELFSIMRNSDYAFGSSSGPMHLASLCGTPHIVWSIPQNKTRYEENWNPLETPVLFMSENNWHPSPEEVYERFTQWKKD